MGKPTIKGVVEHGKWSSITRYEMSLLVQKAGLHVVRGLNQNIQSSLSMMYYRCVHMEPTPTNRER